MKRLWFVVLLIFALGYPAKLVIEKNAREIIEKQVEKHIKETYNKDLDFQIKKLKIKTISLLRFKVIAKVEQLSVKYPFF